MKIKFKTKYSDGDENVMDLGDINPSELRFNRVTREISIVYEPDRYEFKDLTDLSWPLLKKLVSKNGGKCITRDMSIKYMIGKIK